MLRIAGRRATALYSTHSRKTALAPLPPPPPPPPPSLRLPPNYRSNSFSSAESGFCTTAGTINAVPVAFQMIDYAFKHARSQRSGTSYADSLLVLEQGLSNFQSADKSNENAKGMILMAMSTLHAERGDFSDALDRIQAVQELPSSSVAVKVSALEAQIGLCLQLGQDSASLELAEKCLRVSAEINDAHEEALTDTNQQSQAIRALVDLVHGELKSVETYFNAADSSRSLEGRVVLTYGEYLHALGHTSQAKEIYEKSTRLTPPEKNSELSAISAAGMVYEETILCAMCALGQVATHTGSYTEAEEVLTRALKIAEDHFGSNHPKVGVVLTCMANMFRHKGTSEGSSSLLIQEGLYRKAIELMKAPALDDEGIPMLRRDVMSFARGGYSEVLSVQSSRKSEAERLRNWSEKHWGNRRLSLSQALEAVDTSSLCIIDTRIERVI